MSPLPDGGTESILFREMLGDAEMGHSSPEAKHAAGINEDASDEEEHSEEVCDRKLPSFENRHC